jgi:hypothetical protein
VIFSFQRHLPLAQEPELGRDWEFYYAHFLALLSHFWDSKRGIVNVFFAQNACFY